MQEKNLPAVLQTAIKQQAIDLSKVNLMLPTESFGEILGEYDKVVLEVVMIKSDEKLGEVFKIGGKKALGKIPLQKIGNALGIIWDPNTTTILESTDRKSRAKATGAIKKPNGEYLVMSEEKTVDVDIYEEEQQIAKTEEAKKGKIVDGENNRPVRKPWGSEQEKQTWIDFEVRKSVLQYRKFKDERAMTGAKTRAIKALIAIKSAYTDAELSLPFVFPKVIIDANKLLANPEMRQAAIKQMTGNINSIFGEARNVTPNAQKIISISAPDDEEEAAAEMVASEKELGFDDIPWNEKDETAEAISKIRAQLIAYLDNPRVKSSEKMTSAINKRLTLISSGEATIEDLNGLLSNLEKALGGER